MDEQALNMSIRKFLKRVGVTSQREIEIAVRDAASAGNLDGKTGVKATMRLHVPELGIDVTIDEDLALS